MDENTILINGNRLAVKDGETILEVARRNGIDIPTLCHLKGAAPTGACRICVVEVEKARSLLPACATPAQPGMVVHTESKEIAASRRMTLKLLLASGNHNCAAGKSDNGSFAAFQLEVQKYDDASELCPVWGDCKLQSLAYRYQVSGEDFETTHTKYPMEEVNPFIIRDFSRCILCGRCVQACNEIQVNNAISFGYRGTHAKIIASGDRALNDSDCVFCGECVQACPVGALVLKDDRFGRPWETQKVRTTCSYCGVGCQMDLHVKDDRIVRVTGAKDTPPNYGRLCVKGRFGFDFVNSPERITVPLIKENGKFREAAWDEALDLTARRFSEIKQTHGGDSMGVLTSARVSNEDNYIAQKFTRAVLKTNNIDHCARL